MVASKTALLLFSSDVKAKQVFTESVTASYKIVAKSVKGLAVLSIHKSTTSFKNVVKI